MNENKMAIYRDILNEIKYRIEVIDQILHKTIPLRAKIAEELCYLQLRMICELIAIGCLVIHDEIGNKKSDLWKSYKASWIMQEMEKLHSKFYPVPLEREDIMDSDGIMEWKHKENGFLTSKDLSTLWAKSGDVLHRGKPKNIVKTQKSLRFDDIKMWRSKIVNLLDRHIISSPDEKFICYFIMNDGNDRVHSALFAQMQIK